MIFRFHFYQIRLSSQCFMLLSWSERLRRLLKEKQFLLSREMSPCVRRCWQQILISRIALVVVDDFRIISIYSKHFFIGFLFISFSKLEIIEDVKILLLLRALHPEAIYHYVQSCSPTDTKHNHYASILRMRVVVENRRFIDYCDGRVNDNRRRWRQGR